MSELLSLPTRASWGVDDGGLGIVATSARRQAQEIIENVLRGTDPEQETNRSALLACVNRHLGRPERALLEHLVSQDRRRNSPLGVA
jgi:hypothetical protein